MARNAKKVDAVHELTEEEREVGKGTKIKKFKKITFFYLYINKIVNIDIFGSIWPGMQKSCKRCLLLQKSGQVIL